MYSEVAEVAEEDDVGVGGLPVHADAADRVLVHRGRVVLPTVVGNLNTNKILQFFVVFNGANQFWRKILQTGLASTLRSGTQFI